MSTVKQKLTETVLNQAISYVEKDPLKNVGKVTNLVSKIATTDFHKDAINKLNEMFKDESTVGYKILERVTNEVARNELKSLMVNFFIKSNIEGRPIALENQKKYGCNIPWAILMDPTSACNLKCIGCWAGEYNKKDALDYETLDRIITEGKELGIYMYIYSGGEPLVRKNDLLSLAKKHNDCMFLSFTNGTLIDDEFAKGVAEAGNFAFAFSVEGFEKETDMRRGEGTYKKVIQAMDILKKYGIIFGFSSCYHKYNTESIASEEYIDFMIEKGCLFGWLFTYIPIGKDANLDLLATAEQRKIMYDAVRKYRNEKPVFLMDFWNDGEYVDGCIAGGKNYLHINSNGDVEPCAFIHYSNVNIKDVSLIEALQSPIFKQYNMNQPFNENHLRPCPLLDNPEMLRKMVKESNAYSTQPLDREDVDELCDKCKEVSEKWSEVADELWEESQKKKAIKFKDI